MHLKLSIIYENIENKLERTKNNYSEKFENNDYNYPDKSCS